MSVPNPVQPSPSSEVDHVDSKVDLSPSSPISSYSPSTFPFECLKSSNQGAKKKKKKKKAKKKKSDKLEANHAVVTPNEPPVTRPSDP